MVILSGKRAASVARREEGDSIVSVGLLSHLFQAILSDMFIEQSMCFVTRREVGLHLNVCGTQGEVKSRLLFRLESLGFQNLLF